MERQTAERILNAVDAVPRIEYCECAQPRSHHKYWVDRVYDYNGYACPNSPTGSDFRYSEITTGVRYRDACIKAIVALLESPPAVDAVDPQVTK